jgi:chromate transport protein ChrA
LKSAFIGYLSFVLAAVIMALTLFVIYDSFGIPELPPIVIGLGTIVAVVVLIWAFSASK